MNPTGDRIDIVAGSGILPLTIARHLAASGRDVYVAGLRGTAGPDIESRDWETGWYDTHSLEGLLSGMSRAGATAVVLAGRVGHSEIYSPEKFDGMLGDLLASLKDRRPATILAGLVKVFTRSGFDVLPLTEVAPGLFPAAGRLAGPPVDPHKLPDIQLGWRIARAVADLDIGQTAVVKDGAVVAVEAMEGTDGAIRRAGSISGGGLTVAKLAARDHDFRYDIPTVGPDTIRRVGEAGGGVIAVEAGRCLLLDAEKVHEICRETGVTLLACVETAEGGIHWPEG